MQPESSETRVCRVCGAEKPAEAFCARPGRPWCKQCMASYERVRRRQFRIDHADDPKPAPLATAERAVCSRCKIEKPGSEFSIYWQKRYCKRCHANVEMARNRRRGLAPAHRVEYDAEGRRQCTMCGIFRQINQFNRASKKTPKLQSYCKPCIAVRVSRWRAANPSRARASVVAAWLKNGDRYRDGSKRWARAHPEKAYLYKGRRRARKLAVGAEPFTMADWRAVLEWFGYRCTYCWRQLPKLSQDHVQPLSRGGTHALTNIVPACHSCNSRKSNKTLLEFLLTRSRQSS